MTATTPIYNLRYPTSGDALSLMRTYMQQQAEDVESALAGFGGVAAPGAWTSVGAGGGAPAFATGWANFGGIRVVQFRKVGVEVKLRGVGNTTSARVATDPVFVLPVGSRPTSQEVFACVGGSGLIRVDVKTDGSVIVQQAMAAGVFLSLSGIKFDID